MRFRDSFVFGSLNMYGKALASVHFAYGRLNNGLYGREASPIIMRALVFVTFFFALQVVDT